MLQTFTTVVRGQIVSGKFLDHQDISFLGQQYKVIISGILFNS